MSIEQIDEKLKCIMIQINDVANELYQSDPQRCSRLKVAGLNIGCVRADIERAAELAEGQKPTTNTAMDKICPECNGSGLPKFVNQTNCTLCKGRGKLRHC